MPVCCPWGGGRCRRRPRTLSRIRRWVSREPCLGLRALGRAMVDRRTTTKLIRFHPEELREITACARRSGLTPARFIRETALGTPPRARSHAAAAPVLRELARIGRSLEQLAHCAAASHDAALAAQMRAARERHEALVRHFVQRHRQKGGSTP
jgi:hypothetical protein